MSKKTNGYAIQGNENTTKLLNEIKRSSKQYPTLSKAQEQEMIAKYRNNREQLNKLLFLHNMKIVFNIAKKYASKTNDFDSLVQDGMVGLAEAANRFDIDAGIKFITYAHIWVKKYVLSSFYSKNVEVDNNSLSLNQLAESPKDGDKTEFEEYVNEYIDPSANVPKSIDAELSSIDQENICKKLYDELELDTSLSSTDKAVFIDMFYNREKTADIADKYSLTREKIFSIKHKILAKFKDILINDYGIQTYQEIS